MTIEIQKPMSPDGSSLGIRLMLISMTFMGKVSDIAGRRLVYLVCRHLLCRVVAGRGPPGWPAGIALSDAAVPGPSPGGFASLYALIAGRVAGIGAGAMVPVSMALVADLYPPE